MKFTKGHHSPKVVTISTLPNSAKTWDSVPHASCACFLVSRGRGRARSPVTPGRATLVKPSSSPSPGVLFKSHVHTGQFALDYIIIWGNWTEWGLLSERMGRRRPGFPALPPRPHLLAPAILRQTGPTKGEPGTQVRSQGHPRASLLSPPAPTAPRPLRTQMRRGFQGLSPTVRADLRGKRFQQHHSREKKSSKRTPAF